MQPSLINVHAIGQLEGYTHQASMIYLNKQADIKNIQQQLMELLSAEKNMEAGILPASFFRRQYAFRLFTFGKLTKKYLL